MPSNTTRQTAGKKGATARNRGGTGGNNTGQQNYSPQNMRTWNGLIDKLKAHPFMQQQGQGGGGQQRQTQARKTGTTG